MIRIEILDGDTVVKTHDYDADPSAQVIKIGRIASSHLRFQDDDQVSRMHALIERNHDGLFLLDLGSVLGTYVNGQKITRRKLISGDVVSVGKQKFRVTIVVDPIN